MVDNRKIRQVLRTQLGTAAGLPPVARRSWENRTFTPPDPPNTWVRETFMPVTERLVATNQVEATGLVQYDIIGIHGQGTEVVEDLAKAIAEVFKPASSISGSGISIAIDRTERNPGRSMEEKWWMVPVRVTWRTYVQNN